MNTMNKFFFLMLLFTGIFVTACVDNDFDEPENTFTINAENVIDIVDVLAMLNPNAPVTLDDDKLGGEAIYLKATVTADDASGNFFKTVTFQDNSGALSIMADRNEENTRFRT